MLSIPNTTRWLESEFVISRTKGYWRHPAALSHNASLLSFPGGSDGKASAFNAGDLGSLLTKITQVGRSSIRKRKNIWCPPLQPSFFFKWKDPNDKPLTEITRWLIKLTSLCVAPNSSNKLHRSSATPNHALNWNKRGWVTVCWCVYIC